jgi:uncharacterized repeat protein (TIGR01451 family)
LSVIVPNGTIAYNVVVSDTLPTGEIYADNASIGGSPVSVVQTGQTITFPTQSSMDATAGQVTLLFKFDARVVTGNTSPPYTQTQINNANVNYAINVQGDPGTPVTATLNVIVNNPSLVVTKSHSNVTEETGFRLIPISVNVGDTVRYKLEAASSGASPGYNVVITDPLGPFDEFVGIVLVSAGTSVYDSITKTVTWTINTIPSGTVEDLIFDVQVLPGLGAGGSTTDAASYIYGSNAITPIVFGPTDTNEVVQNYPNIQITKSEDITNTVVGNIIIYTTTFTVPNGTLAYNVQLSDVLPVGQQYNDTATLNGLPVIPASVSGQLITFPVIPFLDATNGAITYVYKFEAVITSANVDPTTLIDTQTNGSFVNWYIDPQTPANPENASATVNVTNSSIGISKLQRNVSLGGSFTDNNIIGYVGQIVEYSLTVTNTGVNPVYNVEISDVLSNDLAFVSAVSVPVGTLIHSGGNTNGIVTWSFSPLNSGGTVTAVFSVTIVAQPVAQISNLSSGIFEVSPNDPTPFQAIDSNQVLLDPPQTIIQITVGSIVTIAGKCCKKAVKS